MAGLWSSEFIDHLGWICLASEEPRCSLIPATKDLPSWSWTSCDTPVYYTTDNHLATLAHLENTELVHRSSNALGQLDTGRITLSGVLLRATARVIEKGRKTNGQVFEFCDSEGRLRIRGHICIDEPMSAHWRLNPATGHCLWQTSKKLAVGHDRLSSVSSMSGLPSDPRLGDEAGGSLANMPRSDVEVTPDLVFDMVLLPLHTLESKTEGLENVCISLVLQAACCEEPDTYHRIGVARTGYIEQIEGESLSKWLSSGAHQSINLI